MGLLQSDLPDQVKIWFIFRALPLQLQRQVALSPNGNPWISYDSFRQRATRLWMRTPQTYSQALMAPRGSGMTPAVLGQRPMGYLTTGSLGLPISGESAAGRPAKQARIQTATAGQASGSRSGGLSGPQPLGRRVNPSTSVHLGKGTFNPGLCADTTRLAWLRHTSKCFFCFGRFGRTHQCPVKSGEEQEPPFPTAAMVRT